MAVLHTFLRLGSIQLISVHLHAMSIFLGKKIMKNSNTLFISINFAVGDIFIRTLYCVQAKSSFSFKLRPKTKPSWVKRKFGNIKRLIRRYGNMVKQITYLLKRFSFFLGQMCNDILIVYGLFNNFFFIIQRWPNNKIIWSNALLKSTWTLSDKPHLCNGQVKKNPILYLMQIIYKYI